MNDLFLSDEPRPDGSDQYAVYVVRNGKRHRLAETSASGVVACIETLTDEGQIERGDHIGLLDRERRTWLISPFSLWKGEA